MEESVDMRRPSVLADEVSSSQTAQYAEREISEVGQTNVPGVIRASDPEDAHRKSEQGALLLSRMRFTIAREVLERDALILDTEARDRFFSWHDVVSTKH